MSAMEPIDVSKRSLITVFLATTTTLVTLDQTVANVALPSMMGSVSAGADQIAWVLTSYIVAGAMTLPLTGWLEAHFGRKRVLIIA